LEKFIINGQRKLHGSVNISGSKNSAVAIIPAVLLVDGVCEIDNVPGIKDVKMLLEIISKLGARVEDGIDKSNKVMIDAKGVNDYVATFDMVKALRASYYILGALLGRFKKAEVAFPGGCDFGSRPIDQHIKGFEALGATVEIDHGIIKVSAEKLVGTRIYLDVVSVGATVNIMLAACKAEGVTIIENPAKEPHIVDVANFLNAMGANVKGAGTDVIKITGVETIPGGVHHSIIPDQIEAGTYMIAVACSGGDAMIKNVIPKHMESLMAKLVEMNVGIEEGDDWIRVISDANLTKANIKTLPYPGFPTDMQPPVTVLLCLADGTSTITEGVWDSRFQYVEELKRMGAKIKVEGRISVIEGVKMLMGTTVKATDLRAGAALVLAGLVAEGKTEVYNLKYIDRGYENFEDKLRALGADIQRVPITEEEFDVYVL
jgi:UDP-N-acetylglucosamine 1-carboxyvinyltransferase